MSKQEREMGGGGEIDFVVETGASLHVIHLLLPLYPPHPQPRLHLTALSPLTIISLT